jgi:hypothetical protein
MHSDSLDTVRVTFHFTGMDSNSHLKSILPRCPADRSRTTDGSRSTIEECDKPIASGCTFLAAVPFEFQP